MSCGGWVDGLNIFVIVRERWACMRTYIPRLGRLPRVMMHVLLLACLYG